ncbi:thiolase domain-containing protein [Kribbella sandramycini]|uniref:Acetyl-CoA C-acetyltransferase n=1 Tax=Kribbella sandramycini TaxID=60450 RepID=A0A7Y4KX81_9ACTN|nr:thiolase domain-containing protein [Kribbella sandramycini]MBB6567732.1 acetyl-CoA C-acetyltransferase [Kribbella sandramycini]NOL39672.1 thiolase domain-containing protein [Kribbella sandramycini]
MTSRAAYVVGAFEHPARSLPGRSVASVHAEVAHGALRDAGLNFSDVDAYFCAGDAPGFGAISMAEYLGIRPRYTDSTETGGSAPIAHLGHAAAAIADGRCDVALVTLAGLPRQSTSRTFRLEYPEGLEAPEDEFEQPFGATTPALYALAARRHMYEYGTTSADLAAVKVAASRHAAVNPNARLRNEVTVEEVLESAMIADPLHKLDCCVVTDGGGAVVVVAEEIARSLPRTAVRVLGYGEASPHGSGGDVPLTSVGAQLSGPRAFERAGVRPADIKYASIYDSYTITVLLTLEGLGFCEPGQAGRFVREGALVAPYGRLPVNTDGGGLSNNHPANRGGITKIIEAVRQIRGEANPEVQIPNCDLAVAHGTGGWLTTRAGAATVVLGGVG